MKKCEHQTGEYISSIFIRRKPEGSCRLILNLKNLNEDNAIHTFQNGNTPVSFITHFSRAVLYPAIFGGSEFFDKGREEKNCCAAGKSGEHCNPSQVGSREQAPENVGHFAFWIAHNITLVALRQRTVMKVLHLIFTLSKV